ncbi:hypothetical protein DIS24_g7725 [Lasiodiplodia hormozganensis]|uniref:Uncharacterized protein n=1 Tax=Lasiodiplodia hormozganensis TaxID=869390 RepID=A0AA39Y7H1_9PEZI|nr:hypothetical protein DIS24_g7725 [Lasiodiplodia hormozganensis]
MDYYPDQLMIPVSRGARNLAAQYGLHPGQAGYTTQQLNGSTHAGYPPIHVHAGATFNATIHMNVYPNSSSSSSSSSSSPHCGPDNHPIIFPRIDDDDNNHHRHHHHTVTIDSNTQCRHCDHRFDAPYMLTAHKNRNSLHCACCRQCFASWTDHLERSGCSGRNYYPNDEDYWLTRQHNRGSGRVIGELDELDLMRGGGGWHEDEAVYGPDGGSWVFERRSRMRRRRRRSRGRYGATFRQFLI